MMSCSKLAGFVLFVTGCGGDIFSGDALTRRSNLSAAYSGPIATFVASLYADILGRVASQAEVQSWTQGLLAAPALNRVATADGFERSTESRQNAIIRSYQQCLGRTPGAQEINI